MTTTEFQELSNYEKLLRTADSFRHSQGYYGRLYEALQDLDGDSIMDIDEIEQLHSAKDMLDVVMYLEG